jgi:hypothetical protein
MMDMEAALAKRLYGQTEPGNAMDAEIAHRVFGRDVIFFNTLSWAERGWIYSDGRDEKSRSIPAYSTDIAAAWQIFIWLTEATGRCIIIADMEEFDADNAVIVRCGLDEEHDISSYWHPAPLALCLAAIDYLDRKAAIEAQS